MAAPLWAGVTRCTDHHQVPGYLRRQRPQHRPQQRRVLRRAPPLEQHLALGGREEEREEDAATSSFLRLSSPSLALRSSFSFISFLA